MGDRRFRKPCVILNPHAASGKAKRKWPTLRPLLERTLGPVDARFTEAPDHATALARDALDSGSELVVAIGGDGTLNEVANGFFRDGSVVRRDAALALCPLGTGSDFRRSAGIPPSPRAAIEAIGSRPTHHIDACRLRFVSHGGKRLERYFLNVSSIGLGGEVSVAAKNSFLTPYSGKAAFLWATAIIFLTYHAKSVRLNLDGKESAEPVRIMQIALGNGPYQGGGVAICPFAKLDSGSFEVTVIEETGFWQFIRSIPDLYAGRIYDHWSAHRFRAKKIVADSDEVVSIEVDGEALGTLPLEAEILPSAIKMAGIAIEG